MKKDNYIELLDWSTDILSVSTPILNALGIPITSQAMVIIGKSIKMILKMGVPIVFKDYLDRQLSRMQKERLEDVKSTAIKTIYQLIEKNGWEESHPESVQYTQYAIEYIEEIVNKAVNENRQAKRLFLGAYLGSTLYKLSSSTPNWDNVFYLSSLIGGLTIRQIILVKLMVDNFDRTNDNKEKMMCITNKVAISELKELSNQNMWCGLIGYMPDPTYIAIPLKYICPTDLAKELVGSTEFPQSLQSNVNDIIISLDLKPYSQSGLPNSFKGMILNKLG